MNRIVRVLRAIGIAFGVLAIAAVVTVYAGSAWLIRQSHDVALRPIAVPAGEAAVAEGRRLATIRGCNDGCHGKGVSGGEFFDGPWYYGGMVAPDLTRIAATHSDSELERVIRHGVRQDGRTTFGMPSSMFYHLTDADLGYIIAFLRSLPISNGPQTEIRFGPLARLELLMKPNYAYATEIERDAPWTTAAELQGPHGRGRYLALTVCTECHGMDLKGSDDGSTPNLIAVGAYSPADFARLMKAGIAVGERRLGLMSEVAQIRFARMHDAEVHDLYDYLSSRARDPRTYE